ncbi:MAG TPA: peptide ABC transporter substrate-binding protein [Bacillota bacterium]|nr:peptide ABC transporter substrate-binding protein [Bacillota bacterium]
MNKKWFLISIFGIFALLLTACGFTDSDDSNGKDDANGDASGADSEQVLNLTTTSEIASLDIKEEHGVLTAIANTREGLYFLDKDHQPALAGAESHDVSDDGLVHTFKIRENTWTNGDPVTAHDYEYSWKRTVGEAGYYAYSFANANVENAQAIMDGDADQDELGIEATDDETLVVTLTEPYPLFELSLAFPAFGPINESFQKEAGEDYGQEHDQVVSNGPFYISDWKHGQGWQFKKNEDYWNADEVTLEEVNVTVVKEESTAVNLYESGEIDLVELSAAFIDKYQDDENYTTENTAMIRFLRFNHTHEALGNVNIRRALDMGWDKESLTDVILKNGTVPTYFLVPDIAIGPSGETFREMNGDFKGTLEEAQEYFDKGMEEIGETEIELGLLTADDTDDKATAEYLKDQWEANFDGLTINIVLQPFQSRLDMEKAIDYDISMSTYTPSSPDPQQYLNMWETDANFNRMDYSNEAYDELVIAGKEELDEEKRYEVLLKAEKMLFEEDQAIAPMYQGSLALMTQPYVKGMVYHPTIPEYDLRWTYIEGK